MQGWARSSASTTRRYTHGGQLSARSSLRVLKVARTIADLEHSDRLSPQHVGEALQLRCRDRE